MKHHSIFFPLLVLGLLLVQNVRAQRIMTLEECVEAARIDNSKAREVQYDISIAKEQKKFARTKYFPMLSGSAMHFESSDYLIKQKLFSMEFQELIDILAIGSEFLKNGGVQAIRSGSSVGVTLLEPLFTGGRIHSLNKLADLQVEAREKLQQVTDDEVVMTTQFLYYKVYELHQTDKSLAAMEQALESIHKDAVNIYENGLVNKNDVLSVELMQDELSALRIKAANGRNLLRRALAKYIGMADEDIDIDTTLNADIVAPELLRMETVSAVENRSETQLLDMWVRKATLEKKMARGNLTPMLFAGATANYSKYLSEGQSKVIGFVTLQVPLSAYWSERHILKWKKIEEQKAIEFSKDKRELITLQVQDAYDNLESTYRQTQISERSIARAEENLRITREHYKGGMSTMTTLLDAQRQMQQALTQRNTALCEYLQAKTRYLILTGRR